MRLVTEEKPQASLTQGISGGSAGIWHARLLRAELVPTERPPSHDGGEQEALQKGTGSSVPHSLVH